MKKKEEALTHQKGTLMKNLSSPVAWHVLGILHRDSQNYPEAVKCYKNAHKYDKKNVSILRDLANLQVFVQDYEGNQFSRSLVLADRMDNHQNWITFAIACFLNKKYDDCITALGDFKTILSDLDVKRQLRDFELSEVLLFEALAHEHNN